MQSLLSFISRVVSVTLTTFGYVLRLVAVVATLGWPFVGLLIAAGHDGDLAHAAERLRAAAMAPR